MRGGPQLVLEHVHRGGGIRVVGQGDGVGGGGPVLAHRRLAHRADTRHGRELCAVSGDLRRRQGARRGVQVDLGRVGRARRQSLLQGGQRGHGLGVGWDPGRGQVERRLEVERAQRERDEDEAGGGREHGGPPPDGAADGGEPGALRLALPRLRRPEHPRPSSETIAGTRVSPAIRVTATAMASVGPSERNKLSVDSSRARKATMTTPAAEAMTSPTRVDRGHHRLLGILAGAQPFPVAEHQEQDVVGPDAEQHHDQQRGDRAVRVQVQRRVHVADQPGRDLGDDRDHDQRQQRDDRAAEDDQQQDQDQGERGDRDDLLRVVAGLLAIQLLRRRSGDALGQVAAAHQRLDIRAQHLDRVAGLRSTCR